ncbi:MAG: tyrosine-type recombinase/integrase [Lentisphaeraceae bacterium]|nr:tyrosine-type recombinase/integrase [Lentisphaeraceae bacterium]
MKRNKNDYGIYRQKRANGELSKNWYYRFSYKGKSFKGNTHTSDKNEARECAKAIRLAAETTLDATRKDQGYKRAMEGLADKIIGDTTPLEDVWNIFRSKANSHMEKIPSAEKWRQKERIWNDFKDFLSSRNITVIRQVSSIDAKEYIGHIKNHGKFNKSVNCRGYEYKSKINAFAPSTINEYLVQLRQLFRIFEELSLVSENPFSGIPRAAGKTKKRDIFEVEEIQKITDYLEAGELWETCSDKDFTISILRAIFTVGLNTGLRRGDICTLEWDSIRFNKRRIELETSKTEVPVSIPIVSSLHEFLKSQEKIVGNDSIYVVPELAKMYEENANGISYRFKKMLEDIGIKNKRKVKGRDLRISNKDIHSLRHTFCFLHGIRGTSRHLLMSMTGHLTEAMSDAYTMHQNEQMKESAAAAMEGFCKISTSKPKTPLNSQPTVEDLERQMAALAKQIAKMKEKK